MTNLKNHRQAVKFSQSELARRSGVPRLKICLYELGDGKLTPEEQGKVRAAIEGEAARLRTVANAIDFGQGTIGGQSE
jgi:transcriptional regulator with XRE-family HTH domain